MLIVGRITTAAFARSAFSGEALGSMGGELPMRRTCVTRTFLNVHVNVLAPIGTWSAMQTNDVVDLRLPMYVVGDVVGRGDRTFPIATALELGGVGINRC